MPDLIANKSRESHPPPVYPIQAKTLANVRGNCSTKRISPKRRGSLSPFCLPWVVLVEKETAINSALEHGAKLEHVQQWAGHADVRTTQEYVVHHEHDAETAARYSQIRPKAG